MKTMGTKGSHGVWKWWESHGSLVMRIAICCLFTASVVWLGYQFWRLVWLKGFWGAVDLHQRYFEVQRWFSGQQVYGRPETVPYPPATFAFLWPFLGWVGFQQARWIWAATTVLMLGWFIRLFLRGTLARTAEQRILVALIPLAAYATGATIGNGQLMVHQLPLLVSSLLLATRVPARWADDLGAAALFTIALVKPSAAAPFYWILLLVPRRIRPAALAAGGYVLITLLACRYQNGTLAGIIAAWLSDSRKDLASYAVRFSHENLHSWFAGLGLLNWSLTASLLVLGALGIWVYLHRRIDVWLLMGVVSLVARFYTYHGWYDDVLLFLPTIALFRIILSPGPSGASAPSLLTVNLLFMVAPGGLYLFPRPWNTAYVVAQTVVWLVLLIYLCHRAWEARLTPASEPGCKPAIYG